MAYRPQPSHPEWLGPLLIATGLVLLFGAQGIAYLIEAALMALH